MISSQKCKEICEIHCHLTPGKNLQVLQLRWMVVLLHFPKGKCLKSTPSSFVNEKSTFHRDNAGSEWETLHVNNVQKPVRLNLYAYEFPSYLRLLWDTWSLCTYIDVFGIFWSLFSLDWKSQCLKMAFFSLRFFSWSQAWLSILDSGLIFNMADVKELAAIFLFHFFLKLYFGQITVVCGKSE